MRQMYFTELRDDTDYELRTVFIGNLPHTTTEEDIIPWIRQLLGRDQPTSGTAAKARPDNFQVRCRRGGLHGVHGFNRKIFKRFAFVSFDLVKDASAFFCECHGTEFEDSGRFVVAHPSVVQGSYV